MNEEEIERGTRKNQIEIKDNPGFKTTIVFDKFTSVITINVHNINNINYLYTIPIFLDSLIRITQNKSSTLYPSNEINKLCSSVEQPDIKINDIVSVYEKKTDEYEIPYIENDDIKFTKLSDSSFEDYNEDKDNKRVIGLFFDDMSDEEYDEDEELEGGETSSPSQSLSSDFSLVSDNPLPDIEAQSTDSVNSLPDIEAQSTDSDNPEIQAQSTDSNNPEIEAQSIDSEESTNNNIVGPNTIKNIDGMPLNNPYFFQDRIKNRDPALIITQKQGNFNAYSRICPSSTRRQPVILNEREKQNIDKNYKGFLKEEDIIKYGSNPDNQFYYICPRYWCLQTNSVISEEDVKAGKCGAILPKTAKKVIPGHYVYEFYTPPKNNPSYKHYPGFQDDSHPQGFCL